MSLFRNLFAPRELGLGGRLSRSACVASAYCRRVVLETFPLTCLCSVRSAARICAANVSSLYPHTHLRTLRDVRWPYLTDMCTYQSFTFSTSVALPRGRLYVVIMEHIDGSETRRWPRVSSNRSNDEFNVFHYRSRL